MSNGMFSNAQNLAFKNAVFVETNQPADNEVPGKNGDGIARLLETSIPDACHDSSARYPPPKCHPGTRQDFIHDITIWGRGASDHTERILWLNGPAGVGKSALAQSCAELLAEQGKLGASFFFSGANQRSSPDMFFTSIAYQIATKCSLYYDILDCRIRKDPTLTTKSIMGRFHELLVEPLRHPRTDRADIKEWVIVIDGLDECEGRRPQSDTIEIITTSVRDETTPFRWVIFSRSEPHIAAALGTDSMPSLSRHLELLVTREIDDEIRHYLTEELRTIQKNNMLQDSWPSKDDIETLVNHSGGLWIYTATLVRFISDPESSGPDSQLHTVLRFLAVHGNRETPSQDPLLELHEF